MEKNMHTYMCDGYKQITNDKLHKVRIHGISDLIKVKHLSACFALYSRQTVRMAQAIQKTIDR